MNKLTICFRGGYGGWRQFRAYNTFLKYQAIPDIDCRVELSENTVVLPSLKLCTRCVAADEHVIPRSYAAASYLYPCKWPY